MVDIEVLEKNERSVLVKVTYPDGRVWQNTIGYGAMDGDKPKDWMMRKIGEEAAIFVQNNPEALGKDGHVINAFELVPKIGIDQIAAYWVDAEVEGSEKYTVPRKIANDISKETPAGIYTCSMKTQVVSSEPLSEDIVSNYGLTKSNNFNRLQALKSLLSNEINSSFNLDGYYSRSGAAISKKPIEKSGPFELFRRYNLSTRIWNGRLVLQTDTSTQVRSNQTLGELIRSGLVIEPGKQFTDITTGKRCYFRSIATIDVSEPIDNKFFKGKSLDEYHSKHLPSDTENVRAVNVAYKEIDELGKFSHHPELLVEICDPSSIPNSHSNKFRPHQYLNIQSRMEHARLIRDNVNFSTSICEISEFLCTPEELGIKAENYSKGRKNLLFGNDTKSSHNARDIFHAFNRAGAVKKLSSVKIGFLPCKSGSTSWEKMCKKLRSDLEINSEESTFESLKHWDPSVRVSRSKALDFANFDLLVIEIPEIDKEYENWKRACAHAGVEVQIVTSGKVPDHFSWLNITFGILGKLGGAAFKVTGQKSSVDAWIGLDVSRRNGINMGASSIVTNSEGSPVGWLDQIPMNREKFEDHELRKIIRDTHSGYENSSGHKPDHICILRDGQWFAGDRAIKELEAELEVKITVVSVIKTGNFRCGTREDGIIGTPEQGLALFDADGKGYIQATTPRNGSPKLFSAVIEYGDINPDDLFHDLYWLTNSHIGSTMQVGVPTPVHFAHTISNMFRRNLLRNPDGFSTNLSFL
jgi:hypothetical protein